MDQAELDTLLDGADEAAIERVWVMLVADVGPHEASRRWLAHFAATDAPKTG